MSNLDIIEEEIEIFEDESNIFIESVFDNSVSNNKRSVAVDLSKAIAQQFTKESIPVLQTLM